MRDSEVRLALRNLLARRFQFDANTRIVEEMGIWSASTRIDVAVVNGELHGFEIKSAKDDLSRLPRQVELYSQVFDRLTLVVAQRHLDKAMALVPTWWGVIHARLSTESVRLSEACAPMSNPCINLLQVARLLWRSEMLEVLTRYKLDRGVRSGRIDTLAARIVDGLPADTLRIEVRHALKARRSWLG